MSSYSSHDDDPIVSTRHPSRPQRTQYNLGSPRVQFRHRQKGSTKDSSVLHDQERANSSISLPGALESIRTRLAELSAATAPTPRQPAQQPEVHIEDLYETTQPPELLYNTAPPSYDAVFGPNVTQPSSKRQALASVIRTVGRELVGGKK
ncbi:hypothetical protein FRC03_009824 [Tulasnella sp. 419]|nr:hypothetical protein FRC03_009824 [Tulasnella sp. 419]